MEKWRDPIVEEVRKTREAYARQFNFDLRAICQDLRKRQNEGGRRVVRPEPRRVQSTGTSSP